MTAAALEAESLWTNEDPRLHLRCWEGEGAPLLLTHGMAGNTHWWETTVPSLAAASKPVALDFHGHGDSQWLPEGRYDIAGYAADIEMARHALGWSRFVLAGHSLGARVALEYARRHPQRLSGLVVVDFLTELRDPHGRFEKNRGRAQPYYPDEEAMLKIFRLQPSGSLLSDEDRRGLARRAVRRTEKGWTWKYDWRGFGFKVDPVWPTLPEVRVPTLVVRGEHSTVMDREDFARVVKALPRGRGVELARAHHHVPLDTPSELAAEISRFIAALPPEAS